MDDRIDCVLGEGADSLEFHQPGLTSAHREATAHEGADGDGKKTRFLSWVRSLLFSFQSLSGISAGSVFSDGPLPLNLVIELLTINDRKESL